VKLQERNARRLHHPRLARPVGVPPHKHPGPRGTDTGAGRKERRHTNVQGQGGAGTGAGRKEWLERKATLQKRE
jgi:hypothetical protein